MANGNDREQELIRKIACGDRNAAGDFYDEYAGYLTAVCLRYVAARDDAKDVLQESFMRIFDSIDRFEYRGPGALKAWARRIVVNESLRWLEKRKKVRFAPDDDPVYRAEAEEPDFERLPTAVILEMIGSLPERYRTVFNLYVFEEMSHREIASMLNIAEGSSASRLHRAKALLAKQIKSML
jgi:RNA polymerase sigma-70 factor (ECF subfamily)